jgi:cytochrome c biogenesis protein CcdA
MLASSALSILWFLCGLTAVLSMLSMLGGSKMESSTRSALKWTHRIFGGFFSVGFLVFAVIMIPKYHGSAPQLSSPIATHAYVAAIIFPFLLVKHYIVRVAKKIQRMRNYDKALVITQDQVDHLVGYLLLNE